MDWEILKTIRFRDLFFINHQFLASLSVCPFILSVCEIEQSGNFLCWTLSISHTSCVQLLQNWNRALPDNRCYLKEYIAQRTEKLYLWFGGLWTQPANYFYNAAEMYLCQWHPDSSFKHLPDEVRYETGDSAWGADSSSFQTKCVQTKETEGGLKTIWGIWGLFIIYRGAFVVLIITFWAYGD